MVTSPAGYKINAKIKNKHGDIMGAVWWGSACGDRLLLRESSEMEMNNDRCPASKSVKWVEQDEVYHFWYKQFYLYDVLG